MNKEQLVIAKIADKIKKYQKTGEVLSTNFLDPSEIINVQGILSKLPNCLFGGFKDAERKLLIIGTEDEEVAKEFIEIITIELISTNNISYNKNERSNLSHREILGSILGLGINRDVVGDILVLGTKANIFVTKEISKYILQNLTKVGREKVKVYKTDYKDLVIPEENYKEIKTTVASLRLDAIISQAIGVSREVSAKLIQNEKVKLNHIVTLNTSKQVKEKDIISVRGYGRITLDSILGETRKDRIRVVLKQSK